LQLQINTDIPANMHRGHRIVDMSPERVSTKRRARSPSRSRSRTYSPSPQREVVSSRRRDFNTNGGGGGYERFERVYDRGYERDFDRRRRSPPYYGGRGGGGRGRDNRGPPPRYSGGGGGGGDYSSENRRYYDGRDNPEPGQCLGVFGMSLHTNERDLKSLFGKYGEVESVQIVYDRYSGRSRGFGFVYFTSTKDSIRAKDHMADAVIDGMKVRVDYSVTRSGGPYRHMYRSPSRSPVANSNSRRNRSISRSRSRSR